ncbi:hypothetical protein EVAR_97349_1 [Eumeta japonica]|uniref:Uncharacterized protein n=1 Tax=Eumeta variegata TaxID=151549 RepID=A0A4C1X9E9_EUMVA|nr:hypothetical protein EVAR_97349_1 [Eumeta japonica]
MDTRNPKGVAKALPAFWEEVGYLMKGDRVVGRAEGKDVAQEPCQSKLCRTQLDTSNAARTGATLNDNVKPPLIN